MILNQGIDFMLLIKETEILLTGRIRSLGRDNVFDLAVSYVYIDMVMTT